MKHNRMFELRFFLFGLSGFSAGGGSAGGSAPMFTRGWFATASPSFSAACGTRRCAAFQHNTSHCKPLKLHVACCRHHSAKQKQASESG